MLLGAPGCHYSLDHWLTLAKQQQQQPDSSPLPDATYADALGSGFVRGVLLPARNRHGNAMRLGALLLQGPNPYMVGPSAAQQPVGGEAWWSGFSKTSLAERQCDGLKAMRSRVSWG